MIVLGHAVRSKLPRAGRSGKIRSMRNSAFKRTAHFLPLCLAVAHLMSGRVHSAPELTSHHDQSPARVLLDKLDRAGRASTLEDKRRDVRAAMHALLEAPKQVLLDAMSESMRERSAYDDMRRMLVEQCAARHPEEAISLLDGPAADWSSRAEASWQVWAVIARTEPERALEVAQAFFDPKHGYYRDQLHHGGVGRPVAFIAKAVGETWWKRDGMSALKKLGTLSHADEIDGKLLEGMCGAATTAEECLALLEWFVGSGRKVNRSQKGFDVWWERPMRLAVSLDVAKTKAWIERTFPPGIKRPSYKEADWDAVHFRRVFFHTWAKTSPEAAADWYAAQFGDDDEDGESALVSCMYALGSPDGEMTAGLRWLSRFRGRPHFVKVAASVLNDAGEFLRDDTRLKQVTAWMAALPVKEREEIILASRRGFGGYNVPFAASMDDKILRGAFPDELERRALVERLKKNLKPDEFTELNDQRKELMNDDEFLLPARKSAHTSSEEAYALAEKLAAQHLAATTSLDLRMRLEGMAALDWLLVAPVEKLREILQAHLESPTVEGMLPDDISSFAVAVIEAWVIKDWRGCEQFAWDCAMPERVRRALMIETFKRAASRHPDEVFDRLETLAKENRFSPGTLRGVPDVQCGGSCYMGFVPELAGAEWIKRDGTQAVEKFKNLPENWQRGAITGAINQFTSASAGLEMLNWLEELDASAQAKAEDHWTYHREIKSALSRLAEINLESARQWLEAKKERYAKSDDRFDSFDVVQRAMSQRDPAAAAAWGQKLRPGDDTTWVLIDALLGRDEKLAVQWIAEHPDDLHIESAYIMMADRWRSDKPELAAKMIARMSKGEGRVREAAYLYQSWSRLDEAAAKRFLDDVIGVANEEREEIEKEITRLEKYAFDRRK